MRREPWPRDRRNLEKCSSLTRSIFLLSHPSIAPFKTKALQCVKCLRHRGPDWSGNWTGNNTILCHERLSIVGVDSGAQPLVNGEIYNHRIIRKSLEKPYPFKTHSDCEVIIPLYQQHGIDAPKHLDGMF